MTKIPVLLVDDEELNPETLVGYSDGNYPFIPQAAASSPSQIREGLEAGTYSHMPSPYRRDSQLGIIHAPLCGARAAGEPSRQFIGHISSRRFLDDAELSTPTNKEAGQLASFTVHACPNFATETMDVSVMPTDSIEHGNLGLGYGEQIRLKQVVRSHEKIIRRAAQPGNASNEVHLNFRRQADSIALHIRDQRRGFPWQNHSQITARRALDPNVRGLAMDRRLSFGNIPVATICCGTGNVSEHRT